MTKKMVMMACVATWACSVSSFGDVLVKLVASDAVGQPVTGSVGVNDALTVEVFLSVDAADDPLLDLRGIQLDFTASSPAIEVSSFTWMLEPGLGDAMYVQFANLPSPSVAYTGLSRAEGLILDLTTTPTRVASFDVVVGGAGTLNVIGSIKDGFTGAGMVSVDFTSPVRFTVLEGTLTGGTLDLSIGGPGGTGGSGGGDSGGGSTVVDSDGDGVVDGNDAFPNDSTETTDTDGDGVGDVADLFPDDPAQTGGDVGTGSGSDRGGDSGSVGTDGAGGTGGGSALPPVCGAGAAPSMVFMLSALGFVRGRRRRGPFLRR